MISLPSQRQLILPLLEALEDEGGSATTGILKERIADGLGLDIEATQRRGKIGGQDHNLLAHRVRWAQQHARIAGLVERGERRWSLSDRGREHLTKSVPGRPVTVFFTEHGCAIWGLAEEAASLIDAGSVRLLLSSPPYPLNTRKKYGNEAAEEYVDWLCRIIETLMPAMAGDGSLVINLGDVWTKNSPTVSLYQERTVIALHDRLGLNLCQRFVWHNPSTLPVPTNYVGRERIRVKNAYETLWWLSPSERPYADNRSILEPYSPAMRKLIDKGGVGRSIKPSGHAHREGSFSVDNGGAIAPNVIRLPNSGDQAYTAACREAGLRPHPARMPRELASRMIRFLSRPGELVLDPFGGSGTTALAAEELGRKWITTEMHREYIEGARFRFAA
ncbi:DNA methyltransferase [Sphingomonas sp. 3-13AW]|uniref:DNA methyltransferase n=1 Tax=Sphingomonas sp. 3-13AW TaxID=3050450 RepID=UPI003BB73DFD